MVVDETWKRTQAALSTLVERVTPWLLDLGNWIFGALIAVNLLVLAALLTVSQVDPAVLVATAALALALPLDVAGFFLLRMAEDMRKVNLEQVATSAFVEAGFSVDNEPSVIDPRRLEQQRTRTVLSYSYSLLSLTAVLTSIGMTAAFWHMAWWIAVAFVVMIVICVVLVSVALMSSVSGAEPHLLASKSTPRQ